MAAHVIMRGPMITAMMTRHVAPESFKCKVHTQERSVTLCKVIMANSTAREGLRIVQWLGGHTTRYLFSGEAVIVV